MKKLIVVFGLMVFSNVFAQSPNTGRSEIIDIRQPGRAVADSLFLVDQSTKNDTSASYKDVFPYAAFGYLISNVDTARVNINFQGAISNTSAVAENAKFETISQTAVTTTSTSWRYVDVSYAKIDSIPVYTDFRLTFHWQAVGDSSSTTNIQTRLLGRAPHFKR
jgi:hypothetical protein